jgi:DNA polymerase I
LEYAESIVNKWYSEREEVKEWQTKTKMIALDKGWTQTLLGRYRNVVKFFTSEGNVKAHGLRAAINTPIQV